MTRHINGVSTLPMVQNKSLKALVASHRPDLGPYEDLRKLFHSHPELSEQESDTAAEVAKQLKTLDAYEVHEKIGGHGLAAVLRNGEGPTVLLRADMDALPVLERTGLPYASKVVMKDYDGVKKPVMHACGHDIHVTCLLAAAESLNSLRKHWAGTLILVFQPSEERGSGAQGMVEDGLYEKVPTPDYLLGQHVMPQRAGKIGSRVGTLLAASDSFKITLYGRGGHASMPDRTIDPVIMAAAIIIRLQTIISREIDPNQSAVLTVASVQAGEAENVIAAEALLRVNVRTVDLHTRDKILAAIKRIVKAEAEASGAEKEPLVEHTSAFPATVNDEAMTKRLHAAFGDYFGSDYDPDLPRVNGSEDFGVLATSIGKPSSFFMIGGTDHKLWDDAEARGTLESDIPVNHSPFFAPVMQPTLQVGTDAMTLAAMTFLATGK